MAPGDSADAEPAAGRGKCRENRPQELAQELGSDPKCLAAARSNVIPARAQELGTGV